ncbi:MAG: prolipoprotein diacylglyceryl transferase [Planctomycetes bacterium]|nr:prolipoprotein diacylglyceryl transferase [Planctomycetota bacterium]
MQFPVTVELASLHVLAHPVFESLGYASGMLTWKLCRSRMPGQKLNRDQSLWLLLGAAVGGAIGAKLLGALEWYGEISGRGLEAWLSMKTIVGGLLGGWLGVEVVKRIAGMRRSTGDATVFALVVAIAVGRIGCFLTGIEDRTVGVHSGVAWAVDFGDGPRHPTQLYEIAFLALLGLALAAARKRLPAGALFRLFLLGYLGFRLSVDFIKPRLIVAGGLSAIQLACIGGIAIGCFSLWRLRRTEVADGRQAVQVS